MNQRFGIRLLLAGCTLFAGCTSTVQFGSRLGNCTQPAGAEYALLSLQTDPRVAYDPCGNEIGEYHTIPSWADIWDVSGSAEQVLIGHLSESGPKLGLYDSTGRLVLAAGRTTPLALELRLSPDHRHLAASGTFGLQNPPPGYRPPVQGAWAGVFVRRPDEFVWRTLLSAPVDPSHTLPISWAPTSDALVTTLGANVVEVWLNDGHRKVLGEGCCAKWSPDGKQIAYLNGKGELVLREVSTGADRRPLPGQKVLGPCIEWSPDMRFLSLCFPPDRQPDPNRYISYIGVLDIQKGTSHPFRLRFFWHRWVWGYSPSFRWLRMGRGGAKPVFDLLNQLSAQSRRSQSARGTPR